MCLFLEGYDCNGLYSFCIAQNMPTGLYVRFEDNQFRPEVVYSYISSDIWMDYIMEKQNTHILHKMNNSNKEVRIGP